jgi:hypothetical protein
MILAIPVSYLLQIKQSREALSWPTTSGRVVSSVVHESQGTDGASDFYFDVTYEYQVAERHLSGSSLLGPFFESDAEEWVQAYPPGSWVRVYYDPKTPKRSAVWPEVHSRIALSLLIVLFLAPMALCGLVSLSSRIRKRGQQRSSAQRAGS